MEEKKKILLVEDDPLMIRLYERALALNGFEVELATTGVEAIEKLSAVGAKPAVILLDLMMPEMNGLDALKKMKQMPEAERIPIIVLTNLSMGDESEKKAIEGGATLFLVKSQHAPKEIIEKIKEITA